MCAQPTLSVEDQFLGGEPAHALYEAAFDPFWPDELSRSFYEFLSEHDRLRAYGRELRAQFKRDPTNYDAAVRLLHYADYQEVVAWVLEKV